MNKDTAASSLSSYLKSVGKISLLEHEEVIELSKQYEGGSQAAKNKIVRHNLGLVIDLAHKYKTNDSAMIMDLIQEGNEGLIRAVEKFEYRKNFRFSTYATTWIRYRIELFLNKNRKLVNVPVHTMKLLNKVVRTTQSMKEENAKITPESIAERIEMTGKESKIRAVLDLMQFEQSLNMRVGDDNSEEVGDLLGDDSKVEENIERKEASNWVNLILDDLTPNHREVICLFYGLCGHPELNRSQIANQVGLSRERIRQIVNAATKKMEKFARESEVSLNELI